MNLRNGLRAFSARRCAMSSAREGERPRVLLTGDTQAGVDAQADILGRAGFDIEFVPDSAGAVEMCRRRRHKFQAVVLVDGGFSAASTTPDVVRRLSEASPDVPCVLLPAGASATEAEVAVRTAIRWSSLAYLTCTRPQ